MTSIGKKIELYILKREAKLRDYETRCLDCNGRGHIREDDDDRYCFEHCETCNGTGIKKDHLSQLRQDVDTPAQETGVLPIL